MVQDEQTINYRAFAGTGGVGSAWKWVIVAGGVSTFVAMLSLFILGSTGNTNLVFGVFMLFFTAGLAGIIGGGLGYIYSRQRAIGLALVQFVFDNGWMLGNGVAADDVATSLLGIGDSQHCTDGFGGTYKGVSFSGVVYHYMTGSGKNRSEQMFTNLCFNLSKAFPLILLDDKRNNYLFISDLPSRIAGTKELAVEGDFGNRFRVRVLPGTEQTVLELLTPDFMVELMANPFAADIEIEGTKMFVISSDDAFTADNLQNLFGTTDIVLKHLSEVSLSWQAASSQQEVSQITTTALAPRLKALKENNSAWIVGVVIVVGALTGRVINTYTGQSGHNANLFYVLLSAFVLGTIVTIIHKLSNRS